MIFYTGFRRSNRSSRKTHSRIFVSCIDSRNCAFGTSRQSSTGMLFIYNESILTFQCKIATCFILISTNKSYIISSQVIVSEDRLSTVGHKFYCTIRANHYVNRGTWYYEAKIVDLPEGAATRIGWAQRNANLQVSRIHGYWGFDRLVYLG